MAKVIHKIVLFAYNISNQIAWTESLRLEILQKG